jgi:hypothetical protein
VGILDRLFKRERHSTHRDAKRRNVVLNSRPSPSSPKASVADETQYSQSADVGLPELVERGDQCLENGDVDGPSIVSQRHLTMRPGTLG